MNTNTDTYIRLLNIFPTDLLRASFEKKVQHKQRVIERILAEHQEKEIFNFVINNLQYTKQHTYVYAINKGKVKLNMPIIKGALPVETTGRDGVSTAYYFLKCDSNVIDTRTFTKAVLTNYWPVSISFTNELLTIKVTVMEHNLKEYAGIPLYDLGKAFTEADIMRSIDDALIANNVEISIIDLNKGIKYLWKNDIIDAKFVRFRKDKSISSETMNGDFTLKKAMPETYKDMMARPLERNIFKFEGNYQEPDYPSHFTVEPEAGAVSFTLFPPSLNANQNVLNLILQHN